MHARSFVAIVLASSLFASLASSTGCKKKDAGEKADSDQVTTAKAVADTETKEAKQAKEELKGNGEKWVPQEHELGMKKFKDPAVYVDGVPAGFMKFGDLPVPLPVRWHEEEASVPFKAGEPQTKMVRQRRYSFLDYVSGLGIDVKRIKEVHLYGGAKRAVAVVVSGDKFRKAKDFEFRFGSDVFGKPIPACPPNLADGNCPDNIRALAIYIDKNPPERKGGYFYFGEEKIEGIPYFGRPLRGGVRIYKDNAFAVQLKRHKLKDNAASFEVKLPDGSVRYKLYGFLEAQKINTDDIVEAWLIHKDRRVKKIPASELKDIMFAIAQRGSGQVLVGPDRVQANAIALHTKPVDPKDIPVPEPFELHDNRKQ